jgi:VIT1/CCC1 family predicted Fe2+/Mn2+ transporter
MSSRTQPGPELHGSHRAQWLRAAVLGCDDGIVSTGSLMISLGAGNAAPSTVITAGLAALVAGSLSMAAGEYVSVSSQRDAERADLVKEQAELAEYPEAELRELTEIYVKRGLDRNLAHTVAVQLSEHDALGTHLRDELNLSIDNLARPVQAAAVSATSFAIGSAIPLTVGILTTGSRTLAVAIAALIALGILGTVGARIGGGLRGRAAIRVILGGGMAMAVSAVIGHLVGVIG